MAQWATHQTFYLVAAGSSPDRNTLRHVACVNLILVDSAIYMYTLIPCLGSFPTIRMVKWSTHLYSDLGVSGSGLT